VTQLVAARGVRFFSHESLRIVFAYSPEFSEGSMATAYMKHTFFFTMNRQGWSESWYSGDTAFSTIIDSACNNYIFNRQDLLTSPAVILGYRNSLFNNPTNRGSYVRPVAGAGIGGAPGHGPGAQSDPSYSAALVNCYANNFSRTKKWYMRGFNDDWDLAGGQWTPGPGFNGPMQALQTMLSTNAWGWQGQSYPLSPLSVVSVAQLATGQLQWTLNGGFPGAPPNGVNFRMRVSGILGATQANGVFTVYPVGVGVYNSIDKIAISVPLVPSGKATQIVLQLIPVASVNNAPFEVLRLVSRKPGRVFFSSAGKRRSLLVRSR
jgi:hypothetical protein